MLLIFDYFILKGEVEWWQKDDLEVALRSMKFATLCWAAVSGHQREGATRTGEGDEGCSFFWRKPGFYKCQKRKCFGGREIG